MKISQIISLIKSKSKAFIVLFSILVLVFNILPFASYQYVGNTFTLSGLECMIGKSIIGGKINIEPSIFLLVSNILIIMVIILTFANKKLKTKLFSKLLITLSTLMVFSDIIYVKILGEILGRGKNVGFAYGATLSIVLALGIIAIALRYLFNEKAVTALDFLVLPGLLYFIINNYIPMAGIALAFKKIDYAKGLINSDWVGFDNFKYLFQTKDAFIITRNTLLYNVVFIVLGIITGIIVAICLAEIMNKFLKKFFQTTILVPQLFSMIIVSYIVFAFLSSENGFITKNLLSNENINLYAQEKYWPFILVFINTWKQLGYGAIIFLTSIVGIDKSLYEAASIDGASKWKQIFKITIPQLKPTIITIFLLQVGRIFYSDFGLFYQVPLNSGSLYNVTNTVDTYVYRSLMVNNNISTAAAASAYQAIVGFVIVFAVNMFIRKIDKENALF